MLSANEPGMLKLTSQDLLPWILQCLSASSVLRLARSSKELLKLCCCDHSLAAMAESINSSDERVRALRPEGGAKWSLERLHLCQNPPCLPSIGFAFASDAISINAHHELERTAAILEKHPGLRQAIAYSGGMGTTPDLHQEKYMMGSAVYCPHH